MQHHQQQSLHAVFSVHIWFNWFNFFFFKNRQHHTFFSCIFKNAYCKNMIHSHAPAKNHSSCNQKKIPSNPNGAGRAVNQDWKYSETEQHNTRRVFVCESLKEFLFRSMRKWTLNKCALVFFPRKWFPLRWNVFDYCFFFLYYFTRSLMVFFCFVGSRVQFKCWVLFYYANDLMCLYMHVRLCMRARSLTIEDLGLWSFGCV